MLLRSYLHTRGSQSRPAPWLKEGINSFSWETCSTQGLAGDKRYLGFVALIPVLHIFRVISTIASI